MAEAKKAGGPTIHTRQTLPDWDGWYQRRGERRSVDLGRQSADGHDALAAHAGVSEAHGADELSRGRVQRAAVDGGVLLSGRIHALVGQASLGGPIEVLVDAAPGAVPDRHRRQLSAQGPHRPQARADRSRSGMARPSASGTATRSWRGRRTCRAGRCRTRCSSSATRWKRSRCSGRVADGKTITVETTFYDPEAFTRPLHTVTPWEKQRGLDDPEQRFTYVECRVQSTIINGPDGRPTQMTPVDAGYIDYFGRPWAQNWEAAFRAGLEEAGELRMDAWRQGD